MKLAKVVQSRPETAKRTERSAKRVLNVELSANNWRLELEDELCHCCGSTVESSAAWTGEDSLLFDGLRTAICDLSRLDVSQ